MATTDTKQEFSIDLRSDTVTRPTDEMRKIMNTAITGDDVFAEDPEINELQQKCADYFGMEAGLYCPSGTMTNQIAIAVHTRPGDEVICSYLSHIYNYEGGGIARLSGASVKLLPGERGFFTVDDLKNAINPADSHYARTSLVALEDTCNKGGGSVWDISEVEKITSLARENNLGTHLDGARLWNALVARGHHNDENSRHAYASNFDSISLCLSKGLGCPVGSVLVGSKEFITEAHRVRKVLGGGMRQAGIVAIAGSYALDNHISRLSEDHTLAQTLGAAALNNSHVLSCQPIDTNIVIINLKPGVNSSTISDQWNSLGIKCFPFSSSSIRFVTHHDITKDQVERACQLLCEN